MGRFSPVRGRTRLALAVGAVSDLVGGFADRTFKLPNPSYFLP